MAESFLRQNYCHAVTLGLPSSLPGLLCSPSSCNFTIFHFQMLSTQWHLNISLSKIQAICAGGGKQSVLLGNSLGISKNGHVLDLNIRESNKFSSFGVRRYSGEVPSDFEEVVNIKMAAAK